MKYLKIILIFVLLFVVLSCNKKPNVSRGFYAWENAKNEWSDFERESIKKLKIDKIYVKLFEVGKENGAIIPLAKTQFNFRNENLQVEYIPVIFIRNEAIRNASSDELNELAGNILSLTMKKYQERIADTTQIQQIQIDCDWTESTKEQYMRLLNFLKQKTTLEISITLRLYPYKFPDKMGNPPVDRALLMCYNLLSVHEHQQQNSILDLQELTKYLKGAKKYPLPLDIGLPIYRAMHVYQNNQFVYSLHQQLCDSLQPHLTHQNGLWYTVNEDVSIGSFFLRRGDKVKYEKLNKKEIDKAIEVIQKYVPLKRDFTVSFYQLNESDIKIQGYETMDTYFNAFAN